VLSVDLPLLPVAIGRSGSKRRQYQAPLHSFEIYVSVFNQ
jgi:hypothetical protein